MQSVVQVLGIVPVLFAIGISAYGTQIDVPVVTKYITTEVTTAHQDETITLIGRLCQQSKGMTVSVTIILINNPEWIPSLGIFRYYVVDAPKKTESSALCTNVKSNGTVVPTCLIPEWPNSNNIYIKGTAGSVEAISITLDAEFFPKSSAEAELIRLKATTSKQSDQKYFKHPKFPLKGVDDVYLTQIVTIAAVQSLAYKGEALVNFTFCQTPKTGLLYKVEGTVTGVDGQSAYTQYLCAKLPCEVDGQNVIAHDGRQIPSNTVTTATGSWTQMYALIVCWGGVYDPEKNEYIGKFIFNAGVLTAGN